MALPPESEKAAAKILTRRAVNLRTRADPMRFRVTSLIFRRFMAIALSITAAALFQCKEENQNAGLGIVEAYDALEVAYYIEVNFKLSGGSTAITDGCSVYTNNTASRTITMQFGDCSTTSAYPYHRIRSGVMQVHYAGAVGDTVANRVLTFDNYFVSGKMLEGEITLSEIKRDTIDSLLHSVCTFKAFKVSFPNGTNVTYNGSHTRVWTFGEGDNVANNNTYTVNMLSDSLNISGPDVRTFTSAITSPIKLNFSCADADPGKLAATSGAIQIDEISGLGKGLRIVNFGDGTCDNSVKVTTTQRTFATSVL